MNLAQLIETVKSGQEVEFNQVMAVIEDSYNYTPTKFTNGEGATQQINEAGQNEGSCKLFALAKLHGLTEAQTLALFGIYYRNDVLENPDGSDHQNIRNFMLYGWASVSFASQALTVK